MNPLTKTIRIEVTQEDIKYGKPHNSCECPVARAISRAVGRPCRIGFSDVSLVSDNIVFAEAGSTVGHWIMLFDRTKHSLLEPVEPFSFDLAIPLKILPQENPLSEPKN